MFLASLHQRTTSFCIAMLLVSGTSSLSQAEPQFLPRESLAHQNFGDDASWFLANIPFLEIDDSEIQKIYYYRWKLYRAHIREIGPQGTTITEFLGDVPWARHPYADLNDSSSFHIMEGRWLRDPAYVNSLVDHLYTGGGNDRHFSESIAVAAYAWTLVTGDPAPAIKHLDAMQHIYNLWDDHFDPSRNLYWIEPLLDATEYTISSIDASGAGFTDAPSTKDNENGFTGGYAFRPSINVYQFANAQAIAHLSSVAGRPSIAADYYHRAEALRTATLKQLWNPQLQHFTDIYQRSTKYVTAGTFIRGRELVGYLPWAYDLPPHIPNANQMPPYEQAWRHALEGSQLAGLHGLRTVEPTYPRYLHQYRYDRETGLPECQWNGPSWPFQTSQTLTALANLLHDYYQQVVSRDDYLHLLRQYTGQHLLASGTPDLQEDYEPDTGLPIVGLPRSHHYNHSTYNDLIISGLIGLRPRADDTLELDPLMPTATTTEKLIRYFALDGVMYHGHELTIVYDLNGDRYHLGSGLFIFCDSKRISGPTPLKHTLVRLPPPIIKSISSRVDLAVNPWGSIPTVSSDLPLPSASSSTSPQELYSAIDGRLWFFPEVPNGWSPATTEADATSKPQDLTTNTADPRCWYAIDLRHKQAIASIELFFFADGRDFLAPRSFRLQTLSPTGWQDIPDTDRSPYTPLANGLNRITFPAIESQHLRVLFEQPPVPARFRLVEIKIFAPQQ
jgi:hypothetical protein